MLPYFKQYQEASRNEDDPLTKYGNSYIGLNRFYDDAAAGTLPMISVIVGPAELAEHPPYMPKDGAWLVKRVVDAVTTSPAYNETALIISYDEPGGFGDHVVPFHAPKGTPGEWINDPYEIFGETPVGPGFRVPAMIISPWTRGSYVFTEHADHNSQTMFVEEWLTAQGYKNVQQENITPWRREHMSNLLKAFDFDNPDYSLPTIASAPTPLRNWNAPITTDGPLGALDGTIPKATVGDECRGLHAIKGAAATSASYE
jgi:phospholipase C